MRSCAAVNPGLHCSLDDRIKSSQGRHLKPIGPPEERTPSRPGLDRPLDEHIRHSLKRDRLEQSAALVTVPGPAWEHRRETASQPSAAAARLGQPNQWGARRGAAGSRGTAAAFERDEWLVAEADAKVASQEPALPRELAQEAKLQMQHPNFRAAVQRLFVTRTLLTSLWPLEQQLQRGGPQHCTFREITIHPCVCLAVWVDGWGAGDRDRILERGYL